MNEKTVLNICCFGRTIKNAEQDKTTHKNLQRLLDTAETLRRTGFHKEAREYDERASRLRTALRKKEMSSKFRDLPKNLPMDRGLFERQLKNQRDSLSKIPHVADKQKEKQKIAAHEVQVDQSILLPPSKREALMTSRDAAWHYHQTGGVA